MAGQLLAENPNPFQPQQSKDSRYVVQNEEQALTPYGQRQFQLEMERQIEQERLRRDQLLGDGGFVFTDKSIRMAFIRKVYSILTMQLVIVALIVMLLNQNKEIREFLRTNKFALIGIIVVNFICVCVLSCCRSVARSVPINYIFLFIFTVTSGAMVALVAALYRTDVVLIAVGITAVICFSVTIFACQTSIDFTVYGSMLCNVLMVFIMIGAILSFFAVDRPVEIVFAGIGVLIFSFILIYDTQLMLGGNHVYAFLPEDYVLAALTLYLDVINIFLYVLQMLGSESD